MKHRWWMMTALVLSATLLASVAARADGAAFDISIAQPILPSGATLGSVSSVTGTTAGYDGTGPCTDDANPNGYPHAAVYKVGSDVRRYLELAATDDLAGSLSLCQVALYNGNLTDPFDAAQRQADLVAQSTDCAATAACGLANWLDGGQTYYVVFWSTPAPPPPPTPSPSDSPSASPSDTPSASPSDTPPPGPTDANFSYDAKVRQPLRLAIRLAGYRIFDECTHYYEVINGRTYAVTATSSPAVSGTAVYTFQYKSSSGHWRPYSTHRRTMSSGTAVFEGTGSSSGRRRVFVDFEATATALATRSSVLYHNFVSPKWSHYSGGGLKLATPAYQQQHPLSCEAASFRMAHNYFGHNIASYDTSVYNVTGWDKHRPNVNGGCDPNRAFCGNVDDGYIMRTGYGIHYGPIARAATWYTRSNGTACRPAYTLSGSTYSWKNIARSLNNGWPVVVWGAHKGSSGIYRYTWRAWDGVYVVAYSVEHTWTVVGFHGSTSHPSSFVITDPAHASTSTVSLSSFYAFVKYFKTAVVVRG